MCEGKHIVALIGKIHGVLDPFKYIFAYIHIYTHMYINGSTYMYGIQGPA